MAWLDVLRSGGYGNTLNGFSRDYTDPATGWKYHAVFSTGGYNADGSQDAGTLVNYVGTDGKPWYEGQQGYVYDLNGNLVSQFKVDDFNKMGLDEKIIIGTVLAIAAGAALTGTGVIGGASSSQVSAAASLGPGETLASSSGYSFGVEQSAQALATGVHVSGAELAAINAGAAFTVPSVMASAPVLSSGSSMLSTAGSSVSSMLSTAAGIGTKVLGAVATIAGIKARNAAASPVYAASPGAGGPVYATGGLGVSPMQLLIAAAVVGGALLLSKKG